ncbi:SAM-dependent methyltransferase [Nitratireductor sp. CH_MIT9313-5]|uniref:SAM-dependent methyltransferase n=1 Tax=Nitratireductor sp. CH_MIT9313-5 TaxID=3107764 RepID=UPI00300AFEC6
MTAVSVQKLQEIYATGDDPWAFRTSAYEQAKFAATRAALPRKAYRSALEIGCGNGELARHIAPICERYTGLDAVERAIIAARKAVPQGKFVCQFLPGDLPGGDHDLILLSEILYFLDEPGLKSLARQVGRCGPSADIVCVTWLGPTGNALGGVEALELFIAATGRHFQLVTQTDKYRIDVSEPHA